MVYPAAANFASVVGKFIPMPLIHTEYKSLQAAAALLVQHMHPLVQHCMPTPPDACYQMEAVLHEISYVTPRLILYNQCPAGHFGRVHLLLCHQLPHLHSHRLDQAQGRQSQGCRLL